jgi:pimeloyl-ACP methyl ester carboxylesterase
MKLCGKLLITFLVGVGIAGVNAVAYMQARAMTHFSDAGVRTKRPEKLNWVEIATVLVRGVNVPRPENPATPAEMGLPFETHRFSTSHGPVLEAWYVPQREDRPLVLIFHGYAASKAALLPVASAIHELGYSVLLVDFYGSGGSSGTDTSLGYFEAGDVAASVEYARHTWPRRKIVLYGFSMGGAAVLGAIAIQGVRPDAIVLEATFDSLLNTAKNRFRTMGLPATPLAELLLFWGGIQWGFDPFSHKPVDYARSVVCPSLILHGETDARVPL